jgi:hypothetical protein
MMKEANEATHNLAPNDDVRATTASRKEIQQRLVLHTDLPAMHRRSHQKRDRVLNHKGGSGQSTNVIEGDVDYILDPEGFDDFRVRNFVGYQKNSLNGMTEGHDSQLDRLVIVGVFAHYAYEKGTLLRDLRAGVFSSVVGDAR